MVQHAISAANAPTVHLPPTPPARPTVPPATPLAVPGGPYLARILPSDEGELTAQAMENWFQACASDEPFSLDLMGSSREQAFVLRASSRAQLNLLCKQLEAQYPQCEIQPIAPSADPLRLHAGEHAQIAEFALLQESWMPLKTFSGKTLSEAGADPLAGILAAMETVGSGQRVVAQLALVRAKDTWLGADLRKSVEHPLQHERDTLSRSTKQGGTVASDTAQGARLLALMALIFGGIFGYRFYQAHQWLSLALLGAVALIVLVGFLWWSLTRTRYPLYDMKLVAEKMSKAAFYCQLRVIVIGRDPVVPLSTDDQQRKQMIAQFEHLHTSQVEQIAQLRAHQQTTREQLRDQQRLPQKQRDEAEIERLTAIGLALAQQIGESQADLQQLRARLTQERGLQQQRAQERERTRQHLLATEQQQCHACITGLEVAYRQFTQASSNGLYLKRSRVVSAAEAKRLPDPHAALPYSRWLTRLLHRGAFSPWVLNALELAGLYHLPQQSADLPLVRRVTVKHLLASPEIAHQLQQKEAPLPAATIGTSAHRRYRVPVLLPFDALFSHKVAIGMSRSGKTVLMQLLTWAAMQRVRDGKTPQPGVFCIDPHRDFVMDVLKLIAGHPELESRLVLLDLTDTQYPVALNPLDATMGFTRDQAVSNLMSSFKEIWRDYWGPRMSYFLNAVCLLLYTLNQQLVAQGKADQQYTLLDINPLLQYREYALKVLDQLDMSETWHRELLAWWRNTYFSLPEKSSFRQEIILPILSKIGVFNDNSQLRHIVGQPITKAPIHLAVTEGKIVLCALSTKDMSEEAVNILGSTLVNLLHSSFTLQQHLPLTQRRKVFCALDEFHAFSGSQLDRLLSEDAKLGCAMLLATQNLKRLNKIRDGLMEMVFSNCQQLFAFRVSAADAHLLEEELQERINQKHIISQPTLHCYARLAMDGYPLQIVSVQLAHPASWGDDPASQKRVEELVQASRHAYLPVDEVERRYAEHLTLFIGDMSKYAATLDRQVRGATANQQEHDAANRRADDLKVDQQQQKQKGAASSKAAAQSSPTSKPSAAPDGAGGQPSASRNHRHSRSKHMGKHPVGTAPPEIASLPPGAEQGTDGVEELRPLLWVASGGGYGGAQERERRE